MGVIYNLEIVLRVYTYILTGSFAFTFSTIGIFVFDTILNFATFFGGCLVVYALCGVGHAISIFHHTMRSLYNKLFGKSIITTHAQATSKFFQQLEKSLKPVTFSGYIHFFPGMRSLLGNPLQIFFLFVAFTLVLKVGSYYALLVFSFFVLILIIAVYTLFFTDSDLDLSFLHKQIGLLKLNELLSPTFENLVKLILIVCPISTAFVYSYNLFAFFDLIRAKIYQCAPAQGNPLAVKPSATHLFSTGITYLGSFIISISRTAFLVIDHTRLGISSMFINSEFPRKNLNSQLRFEYLIVSLHSSILNDFNTHLLRVESIKIYTRAQQFNGGGGSKLSDTPKMFNSTLLALKKFKAKKKGKHIIGHYVLQNKLVNDVIHGTTHPLKNASGIPTYGPKNAQIIYNGAPDPKLELHDNILIVDQNNSLSEQSHMQTGYGLGDAKFLQQLYLETWFARQFQTEQSYSEDVANNITYFKHSYTQAILNQIENDKIKSETKSETDEKTQKFEFNSLTAYQMYYLNECQRLMTPDEKSKCNAALDKFHKSREYRNNLRFKQIYNFCNSDGASPTNPKDGQGCIEKYEVINNDTDGFTTSYDKRSAFQFKIIPISSSTTGAYKPTFEDGKIAILANASQYLIDETATIALFGSYGQNDILLESFGIAFLDEHTDKLDK